MQPIQVILYGADESLHSLLSDVLGDMGLALRRPGPGEERADVVLVLVQQGDELGWLRGVGWGPAPVVALLPFEDERLRRQALRHGASGCYALGTPLEALRQLLRDLVEPSARSHDARRHDARSHDHG